MPYWLDIPSHVRRQIEKLPNHVRPRVQQAIVALRDNPKPKGAKALDNELVGYYRIRVDIYRIVYSINEDTVTIVIMRVAKRDNNTYTNL